MGVQDEGEDRLLNPKLLRVATAASLAIALAGCGASGAPATTPTPGPVATTLEFTIRTPANEPQACMDALMGGTIVRTPASGLGLQSAGAPVTAVEWPFGYTAAEANGRVSLLDETGKVVAREGDEITIGGGMGNLVWYACGPVTVTKPFG